MTCAVIMGGWTTLAPLLNQYLQRYLVQADRIASFVAAFGSAFAGMTYWHAQQPLKRTLDLTLVAFVRAIDMLVQDIWRSVQFKHKRGCMRFADTMVFALSCTVIMRAWFYYPERLPHSYRKWITRVADMDHRLLEALRGLKHKEVVYGEEGPHSACLETYAVDCGLSKSEGNLAKTHKISCDVVHGGHFISCETHAIYRWRKGFVSALMVYVPLNLLLLARRPTWRRAVRKAASACRSSCFIATFIASIWYAVCFTRSRIAALLPANRDESIGPLLGCTLCGWSIFLEQSSRRGDMALYGKSSLLTWLIIVAPRAIATLIPPSFHADDRYAGLKERLLFSSCVAVLLTGASRGSEVRGWMGGTLKWVMNATC